MSFLKRLFGGKDQEGTPKDKDNTLSLDRYREISWMTDERLRNLSVCLEAGFKPAPSLPTDLGRRLRPALEIACRLNGIKALVLWLMVPPEHLPDEKLLGFVDRNGLGDYLTEDEQAILSLPRDDDQARNMIGWKFENAWSLAWYFGYPAPEITGQMMTGEQMQEIMTQYSCPLAENVGDWVEGTTCLAETDVIQKEDLFFCLHNAVRSAQLGGDTVPEGFDPVGNGGVIHERRHSLTWMLSPGASWEETDLST